MDNIWDIFSMFDGSEKEHSDELKETMRKSHKNMIRKETGGYSEAASAGGCKRIMMDGALEETIHKLSYCEYCGETNIPTNMATHHTNGKCNDRKKLIESMKQEYDSGIPLLQVAKKYGYSYTGLERIFVNEGIQIKTNKKLDEDKVWRILEMLDEGISKSAVANTFGISYFAVDKIIKGKSWVRVVEKYKNKK
jgi:hypothetical protein